MEIRNLTQKQYEACLLALETLRKEERKAEDLRKIKESLQFILQELDHEEISEEEFEDIIDSCLAPYRLYTTQF